MIGKWTLRVDERPHCTHGWRGTRSRPACSYPGAHFCTRLANHRGRCRCVCGAMTLRKPEEQEEE